MIPRGRTFRWWFGQLTAVVFLTAPLTTALLATGLLTPDYIPPGGLKGPVCFKAGGLFSGNLFRSIDCIGFFGAPVAGYLLSRGLYILQPLVGVIMLTVECVAAAIAAFALSRL